jgi:TatD DNase family protein
MADTGARDALSARRSVEGTPRAALVDSHCHLDFPELSRDLAAVLGRARAAGIGAIVVPGTHPDTWPAVRALVFGSAPLGPVVVGGAGLHPECLPGLEDDGRTAAALAALDGAVRALGLTDAEASTGAAAVRAGARDARTHDGDGRETVAGASIPRQPGPVVGECGLDGDVARGRFGRAVSLDRQRAVLDAHVEVARALGAPLVLHVWRAHGAMLAALARHGRAPLRGVVHSYSGPAELVPAYVALGLHLSFAAAVTRPTARRPLAAARAVPAHRLLVETDAPAQVATGACARAPAAEREAVVPPRGEPADLPRIAAALAVARGESLDALARRTTANARELFGLPTLTVGLVMLTAAAFLWTAA